MRLLITGAAGFIGSNLVDRYLALGHQVTGFDNFSTGRETFLAGALAHPDFRLIRGDLMNFDEICRAVDGHELVLHLAANADVRFGTQHPRRDLEQNTLATWNVLEAMRRNGVRRIGFSSTGSVYGEAQQIPTPEDCSFPVQTSLYGASKLAAEGLICAYAEGYGIEGCIFRFVSILGERYTHGHVFDFVQQLRQHPGHLHVLGNGRQRKSYLYVQDCVDAIVAALERPAGKISILNLGTDEYCEVLQSVGWICERLQVQPEITLAGGERGWIGDNPFIFLDCSRMRGLGWAPKWSIRAAVLQTVDYLLAHSELLEA